MNVVELLYAENSIGRKKGIAQQVLGFFLSVENLAYTKTVEVRWAGENGVWETLPAVYVGPAGDNREIWCAQTWRQASAHSSLPGNIQYSLYCRANGAEYWINRNGANFSIAADAGLRLRDGLTLLGVAYSPLLQVDQKTLAVTVAVSAILHPQDVFVEWSTDGWQTTNRTPCFYARDHWDKSQQSNARNPNQYGVQVYTGRIRIRDAFRVEYAFGCVSAAGELWDNNDGVNYCARRADLKVLTLNLHCYQEEKQDAKFSLIARAINELDIDIICLQEVAENWNDGKGDWNSNAAKIILERLDKPYHLFTDWAHLGFDRYREGVAVLSKFPLLKTEARYVSRSHDVYDIHARKTVMVQIDTPYIGLINIFSAHLSWWSDGFREQFDMLVAWANRRQTKAVVASLLCGDFNIKAGAEGYMHVVGASDYEDQVLKLNARATFDRVFRRKEPNWPQLLHDDHRIDFIFMRRDSALKPTAARVLFTDQEYGRVSDHVGFLMHLEPR